MTVLIERPTPAAITFPLSVRARWSAAALFLLGGLLQLAEFLFENPLADPKARVAWWLAHDTRLQLSQTVGLLAVPVMIASFLYGYRLIKEQSRRLSVVSISLIVVAMVGLAMVHGVEIAARLAAKGGHPDAAVTILKAADPGVPVIVGFIMFMGCAVLGQILVAIAFWRSRYVPRVVPALVIAFAVVDFALNQGLIGHVLDLGTDAAFAWACLSGYVRKPRAAAAAGAH